MSHTNNDFFSTVTTRTLNDFEGQPALKQWLRDDIALWQKNDLRATPMGYLLCGPVGTGKTYAVECLAGEAGVPVVKISNFRDRWVGSTEGNLEKIFRLLRALGKCFVFVDEAHRTQSGKMHIAMKQLLPDAMFIGFTGTPLLKADKATSIETFGSFIHTYKFDEAVSDGVVLDLRYEARNIDQNLSSPGQVDKWFEVKTQGMTDLSKADLNDLIEYLRGL